MSWPRLLLLYFLALGILLVLAPFQGSPGYMDADYHFYMGQRLAGGQGFSENLLWNYLDDPQSLPHPSHAYWPPLPSVLAALGLWVFPAWRTFSAARLAFILLGAAIPPLTALLAFALSRRPAHALWAGLLALFPAYYLPYLGTTDSFTPSMVLGAAFFILLAALEKQGNPAWIAAGLGLTAGLLHLTRAEGVIWLGVALLAAQVYDRNAHSHTPKRKIFFLIMTTYLLVMLPWFLRNLADFGAPLAPGASRTLWLASYDELFAFPPGRLDPARWLASGWQASAGARLNALGQNGLTALAVQGGISLTPLVLAAAWSQRQRLVVRMAALGWLLLFLSMSLAFPFTGVRGGFFHAGAALQPLLWALATMGIFQFVGWGAAHRGWNPDTARKVFLTAALALSALLSLYVLSQRVQGADSRGPVWDDSYRHYRNLAKLLSDLGVGGGDVVMVNNPPGFALASSLSAIVIPDGDLQATLSAAKKFGADYLLLEANHPAGLGELYGDPRSVSWLQLLDSLDGTHVFRILNSSETSP